MPFSENQLIAIFALLSSLVALFTAMLLVYGWKKTKKPQRLEWSLGLLAYALGHIIVFFIYGDYISLANTLFWIWLYVNCANLMMALILKGILRMYTKKKPLLHSIPIFYGLFFFLGTILYAFVLSADNSINFIMLGSFFGQPFTQLNNMSWFVAEAVLPISLLIGILFSDHWYETKMKSSLFIAIHFLGYAILLVAWPFDVLKLSFYFVRIILTIILALGFIFLDKYTIAYEE